VEVEQSQAPGLTVARAERVIKGVMVLVDKFTMA